MARNVQTFGNPIGATYLVEEHANRLLTLRGWISILVRHASLHAGTPWEGINGFLYRGIIKIHLLLDLSMDDPRTTSIGPFMFWKPRIEESFAGNSLHAYLYLLVFLTGVVSYRRFGFVFRVYGLLVIATFLVFSFVFKWQVFSSRYHLPFFVLFAPVAGVVLDRMLPARVGALIGIASIFLSWPWLLKLENRPLLQYLMDFRPSGQRSVAADFLNLGRRTYEEFAALTDPIEQAGCSRVAVMLSGNGREYPIWANLGAPRKDLEIQWIVVDTPSEKYRDLSFEPCAAICQNCPEEWDRFQDLPLFGEWRDQRLFLRAR